MSISSQFTADFTQFNEAAASATEALAGVREAASGVDVNVEEQSRAAGKAMAEFGRQVVDVASDFIGAYAEEEAATARLSAALKQQGTDSQTVIAAYQAMAEQFQQTTTYSDDAITKAQTAFTTIGKLGPEQMQPAIQAAADLAAHLGIGIEEAASKMAKAIASGGTKLGTLKAEFGDLQLKGKSADEMIAAFSSRLSGEAAAAMDTTSGRLTNFQNKFDDFKGKVGEVLANALTPLLDAFMSLPSGVQTMIVGIVGLGTALAPLAMAFGGVVSAVAPLIGLIGGAGGLVAILGTLAPFLLPAGVIIAGITAVYMAFKHWDSIVAIVQSVYDGVKRWLVDGFNALVSPILSTINAVTGGFKTLYDKVVGHSYVPDMIAGIGQQFGKLGDVMVRPAEDATGAVLSAFNRMSHNLMLIETDSGGTAHDLFGRPVVPGGAISALPSSLGQQNIQVIVNGSVLSTEDQIAMVMENAMMSAYTRGGNRLPV